LIDISRITVGIRGGGDVGSGVAWRLHRCGFPVFITEVAEPLAVRRTVSFCEAVYEGRSVVEGVEALRVENASAIRPAWMAGKIPVLVDPDCRVKEAVRPKVLVDAVLAKRNLGTTLGDAPLVIALGPGFCAGVDAHFVIETQRGHRLGRLLSSGSAEPDTGIPEAVMGITSDRVLRAPCEGYWSAKKAIGDLVRRGDIIGAVEGTPVKTATDGIVRGLIRPGVHVARAVKIGDVDPRGDRAACQTISDKALAIAGGVLEGILRFHAREERKM
jgi:xanthine dehydrogenase accessory factor